MTLHLTRARRITLPGDRPDQADPAVRRYIDDMLGGHGVDVPADRCRPPDVTVDFTSLSSALVDAMAPVGEVDLVLLAQTGSDGDPFGCPASHLTDRLPGASLAFAISDQGVAAPFTALRIAQAYRQVAAGRQWRCLLVILDATGPTSGGQAVGLLLSGDGPLRIELVAYHADVGAAETRGFTERVLHDPGIGSRTTVITGPAVAVPPEWSSRTSVITHHHELWHPFAESAGLPAGQGADVVLIEYDPILHYHCALRVLASSGGR
jgi:hypothetical protein